VDGDPVSVVTCHTDGCAANGDPREMDLLLEVDGDFVQIHVVMCGACGQQITDIADA